MAPAWRCLRAPALLLLPLALPGIQARTPALRLTGDAETAQPPTLQFGQDPAAAVVITSGLGDALQVQRGGQARLRVSEAGVALPDVALGEGTPLEAVSLSLRGVPQWALWDLETFDVSDDPMTNSNLWSVNDRGFCATPGDEFLGGHCRFAATATARRYNLPPHSRVRLSARVHFIDAWLGESVLMQADGKTVWAQAHNWCPGILKWMCSSYGMNTCGQDTPDRLSVRAEAILAHTGPTLDIAFSSSLPLGTDACRTSWGVDDVSVELM